MKLRHIRFVIPAKAGIHYSRRRQCARSKAGFTLVEVIVSLLLVGIVGVFSLFFLADGIEGYFISQEAADSAFKAQIALDRIRLELIEIGALNAQTISAPSVEYTSTDAELSGNRALYFSGGTLYLQVDGSDYPIIGSVTAPILQIHYEDMDNDSKNEVAYINIGFTLAAQPAYSIRVYPRNLVEEPS